MGHFLLESGGEVSFYFFFTAGDASPPSTLLSTPMNVTGHWPQELPHVSKILRDEGIPKSAFFCLHTISIGAMLKTQE